MRKKTSTPEEKLAWLKKQKDHWFRRTNEQYSVFGQSKLDYYTEKVRYWEARINYCGDSAAHPSPEDREQVSQQLR